MKWGQVTLVLGLAAIIAAMTSTLLVPYLQDQLEDRSSGTVIATVDTGPTDLSDDPARRSATLNLKSDGHYWGRALVNQKSTVEFMVDTGASVVALTLDDARRIGLDPEDLDFVWDIRTAGGIVKGASVVVDTIQIHQVKIRDVDAMVLPDGLDQSLLGMSFLRELYSYEVRGDRMIIRQ